MRIFAVLVLVAALGGCDKTDYRAQANAPLKIGKPQASAAASPVAEALQAQPSSLEDYKRVARFIGGRKAPIYYKAFIKAPDRFKGERVKINVKVMDIKEQDGQSLMNVWLSRDLEPGIVTYRGSLDVYDGDIITVYGEVVGSIEGTNRMGAQMTWPAIEAKYVKVVQRGSAD